jgi:hypothetical protein
MEVADHLRRAGRWAWLLVLLPVLSAAVAFAVLPRQPPQWTSTATVLAAPGVTSRTGGQYISDFQAALTSDPVVNQLAKETGVTVDQVQEGLSAQTLASGSSLVQVSYTSPDRSEVTAVPALAAQLALRALIQPQLDTGKSQLDITQRQYDAALRAREQYTSDIGVQLPAQAYQSGLAEVSSLRNSYQIARFEGKESAAGLLQQLETRTSAIDALAPQVVQYNLLQNDVERSYNELNRLRFSLAETEAQLDAAGNPSTVTPGAVTSQISTSQVVRPLLTAAVAGFAIAVLVVAALTVLFSRRPGTATARHESRVAVDRPVDDAPQAIVAQGPPTEPGVVVGRDDNRSPPAQVRANPADAANGPTLAVQTVVAPAEPAAVANADADADALAQLRVRCPEPGAAQTSSWSSTPGRDGTQTSTHAPTP